MKKYAFSSLFLLLLFSSALVFAGCQGNDPYGPYTGTYVEYEQASATPSLKTFSTIQEYQEVIGSQSSDSFYYGDNFFARSSVEMTLDSAMPTGAKSLQGELASGGVDFSGTNNQVATVDEADLLKTDGKYIYTITGQTVFIVDAYPGENASLVSTIPLEDYQPEHLFLAEQKLVVFGNLNNNEVYEDLGFRPRSGLTFVQIYDVQNPAKPELVEELTFEGRYYDARLVQEHMYLVLRNRPEIRDTFPTPIIMRDGVTKSMPIDSIYYRPMPYNYPELITTHAIALDDFTTSSVAVTTDSLETLYMSEENIYLVSQEYISEWDIMQDVTKDLLADKLTSADKILIEKIKKTDNDVLSQWEKEQKILEVYYQFIEALPFDEQEEFSLVVEEETALRLEAFEYMQYAVVDKIAVQRGKLAVVAQGKVPGRMSNQFSLDEHDGYLRVATTIDTVWSSFVKERADSTNNVWVLDSNLKTVGQLTGLASGEQIYSTRFIGDRLYMVTFKQIDPFFVIDLSNPKKPVSLGELKIPGFSRYLHPYDENHIIGIGREASDLGRVQGLKISLFDVTDVAQPKEVAKFVTEEQYAQSSAEYEHKAFLFSKEKNLLVIPAYSYDYRKSGETYNGAFVFSISPQDITLRGLIDHSSSLGSSYYYQPGVQRSLYINELLYTKSPSLLRINDLETLAGVKSIDLKQQPSMNVY